MVSRLAIQQLCIQRTNKYFCLRLSESSHQRQLREEGYDASKYVCYVQEQQGNRESLAASLSSGNRIMKLCFPSIWRALDNA